MKILLLILSMIGLAAYSQQQEKSQNQRRKRRPPREAINACSGLESGKNCTFEHRNKSLTGTCFAPKPDLPLACKPTR